MQQKIFVPVGRLLIMPLPLVFAVQKSLELRGRVLVLGRQRGRLAGFTLPAGGRRATGTRLLGAALAIHQVHSVHAVLNRGHG